jgi:transcription antitermination protein NusB
MISRRNIRVKVMQTLYTLSSLENGANGNRSASVRILDDKLRQVLDLFTASVLYTIRIAQYADTDARNRAAKYLTTADDRNADMRIAENSFIQGLLNNVSFTEKVKKDKLDRFIDEGYLKKLFQQLQKTAEYIEYVSATEHTPAADKAIIQFLWEKQMMENEDLLSHFVDELPGWEDDSELIIMLMQNFFRGSSRVDFTKLLSGEKKNYAHDLLLAVIDKDELCMELITPKLTNWDKDRVAMIDMMLLRMGVCEFLFFPTIPTKVTINEYIDVAKQYSTPQSGQFVNGVLDNILKDLTKDNKITKSDRQKN